MKTNWNTKNNSTKYSSYIELVERIYSENNKPTRYKGTMESMLREFFSKTSKKRQPWKRTVFRQLLITLYEQRCYALLREYKYVAVLHNMCAFGDRLERNVADWKRGALLDNQAQLSALIQHCFARYEAPLFLNNSFYGANKKHMLWYVQLAKGKSVKDLSQMPIALTNKMAHEFRNAPAFLDATQALRYAQALGFGATKQTAKVIAFSRVAEMSENQKDFWASVVQFFSKEEKIEVNEVNLIIDYLAFKKREDPSFTVKNRTLNALQNQTQQWHRNVYLTDNGRFLSWNASGIKPLYVEEVVDNKKVVYKTIELLNSAELYTEGLEMQHCVSEYDEDCKEGGCYIFSLQQEIEGEASKRLLTLEVGSPDYNLVQAKGKYNQEPNKKSLELLNLWIENSEVRGNREVAHQMPLQVRAHVRAIERRQLREGSTNDFVWILKIVAWLLYFIMRMALSY